MRCSKEIERKFLVKELPKGYKEWKSEEILQGYIIAGDDGEVRIRKKGNRYYLTVKGAGDLSRPEKEIELTEEQYKTLWPLTIGRRIKKVRYEKELGHSIAELDIYKEKLKGLKIVEVEFTSEKEANNFKAPPWFGEEVTRDARYKNKNLAVNGKP